MNLEYGMKIKMQVNPIKFNFMNMFGITSSNSETVEAEFTIDKYWEDDVDANRYKVKCIPTDKSGFIGIEKFYSLDLKLMINKGIVTIVNN